MATNDTEVRLLYVPLEDDNIHQIYFDTLAAQEQYFIGQTVRDKAGEEYHFQNFTYQRADSVMRIPVSYDDSLACNYVMYRNQSYDSKWHYAFITDRKFKSSDMTEITIDTDSIQTWLKDFTFKPTFIERAHVDIDIAGNNTVPEVVELGEYICNNHTKAGYCSNNDLIIIVGATKSPEGENAWGTLYNNIYSGVDYYAFRNNVEGARQLKNWLADYSGDGAAEAITCMFLVPENLVTLREDENDHTLAGGNMIETVYINGDSGLSSNKNIDISTKKLDGYTPKNKKLLTFPYRYLLVSNNAGCAVPMHYELFQKTENGITTGIEPRFNIEGVLCPGGSVRMIPINYKGIHRNDEEGINLGKFPALNWTSDMYTNWLTQNGVNIAINAAASIGSIAAGIGMIASGAGALAGAGAIAGGVMGVSNSISEVYSHSLIPPQAQGNLNSGDVVTAGGNNDFHFYDMSIRSEYAVIIDHYFSMYGYKINRVMVPKMNHRENYWYTKTIDANIDGVIPAKDMKKIKECFNKGITFWKNPKNIGNYDVSNLPIGG